MSAGTVSSHVNRHCTIPSTNLGNANPSKACCCLIVGVTQMRPVSHLPHGPSCPWHGASLIIVQISECSEGCKALGVPDMLSFHPEDLKNVAEMCLSDIQSKSPTGETSSKNAQLGEYCRQPGRNVPCVAWSSEGQSFVLDGNQVGNLWSAKTPWCKERINSTLSQGSDVPHTLDQTCTCIFTPYRRRRSCPYPQHNTSCNSTIPRSTAGVP